MTEQNFLLLIISTDFANDESNSAFIEKQVHSGFGSNGSNGNGTNTGVSDFMAKILVTISQVMKMAMEQV